MSSSPPSPDWQAPSGKRIGLSVAAALAVAVVVLVVAVLPAEYGIDPENAFAPLGYDAMMLVADAIGRAGSAEPAKIREALAATRGFKAVTGEISYTRDTMVPPKPVSVISVKKGQYAVEEIWRPEGQ